MEAKEFETLEQSYQKQEEDASSAGVYWKERLRMRKFMHQSFDKEVWMGF